MENLTMNIKLTGDALKLFEDFLKYGTINMDDVADAMYYDKDGFDKRLFLLQGAYVKARDNAYAEARKK